MKHTVEQLLTACDEFLNSIISLKPDEFDALEDALQESGGDIVWLVGLVAHLTHRLHNTLEDDEE